jgi:hypothetical protein
VADGYFSVLLGSGDNPATPAVETDYAVTDVFAAHDATWIAACVGQGCLPANDLLPRQPIGSVPYAARCANAGAVEGFHAAALDERYVDAAGDMMSGRLAVRAPVSNAWSMVGYASDGKTINWQAGSWHNDEGALGLSTGADDRTVLIRAGGSSFLAGGALGVGTKNPQHMLDVGGNARVSGTLFAGCASHQEQQTLSSGNQSLGVTCPAGKSAVGGGANCAGWDYSVKSSYPSSDLSGWNAQFNITTQRTCSVWAICCRFGN